MPSPDLEILECGSLYEEYNPSLVLPLKKKSGLSRICRRKGSETEKTSHNPSVEKQIWHGLGWAALESSFGPSLSPQRFLMSFCKPFISSSGGGRKSLPLRSTIGGGGREFRGLLMSGQKCFSYGFNNVYCEFFRLNYFFKGNC